MKMMSTISVVVIGLAVSVTARMSAHSGVTPLQKVLEMLDGMLAACQKAKHVEQEEFAEFQQWCDSSRTSAQRNINEAASQIEQLQADLGKAQSDAEEMSDAADDLLGDAAAAKLDAESATAIRKKEKTDFDATHADFSESIDAIERAIVVLNSRKADVPQSLLQVIRRSKLFPVGTKDTIDELLALKAEVSASGSPKANAYEFQSTNVVDMLKNLRLKFQDERLALEKAEMAAKSNYEMIMQRLTTNIKRAQEVAAEKTKVKAERLEDAARAKADLSITEASKAEDEKKLSQTVGQCESRSKEFDANQLVRTDEMKAIQEAVDILNSDAVAGGASTYLPSAFIQHAGGMSLAQLRGVESSDVRRQVVEFLQDRASSFGSRYLSLVAAHAEADPFEKVKGMIKELIVKLMEEANSEADHQAYCKAELATNKQTRQNQQSEVDVLMAQVEQKTAEIQQLGAQLSDLSDSTAELESERAQAVKMRGEEQKTNTKTISDAKDAQVAVERAMQILKEFYATTADTSFLQSKHMAQHGHTEQSSASAPYTGMRTEHGNVVGVLEVILSDFARLEAGTAAAEDQAQESHEKFMAETSQELAVKATEIRHKEKAKAQGEATTSALKKDLDLTQNELEAAMDYYDKLKADCVDIGLSYSERAQKREEEIQSLQEALEILNQQELA
jgi:uncharacterized membrane protein